MVDIFYGHDMYEKFLEGLNCKQGMGMYDNNQELDLNQIPDGKVIVIQNDGEHVKTYGFTTVFKTTMRYKGKLKSGKLGDKSLILSIRRNIFSSYGLNLVIENQNTPFPSLYEIKEFLKEKYGSYTLAEDWSVYL